jgi:hypothetical protein
MGARSAKTPKLFCPNCNSGDLVRNGLGSNYLRKQRYRCNQCGRKTTSPNTSKNEVLMHNKLPKAKRYLITSAQNASRIFPPFWKSLMHCKEYYDAELIVRPGRYKNPTSQWTQKNKDHEWWDEVVLPYLYDGWLNLNDRLIIIGTKVQWSTQYPLRGLDTLTKDKSGIVGHGNRALTSISTPHRKHPKIMFTTGACTLPNYTDSKTGDIAKFNHSYGALIVEIDGDTFYARQLNATNDGSFIDLDVEFTPDGAFHAPRALTVALGDLHHRFVAKHVVKATFDDKNSLVKMINPEHLIIHDMIDQYARNHHHVDNWLIGYGKWKFGLECIRTEIEDAVKFVNKKTPNDCQAIVVPSNHDDAVGRWLLEASGKSDPVNVEFYFETGLESIRSVKMTKGGIQWSDPFIMCARRYSAENVRFLAFREPCVIGDVEYSLHGHQGPNGTRGSTLNLSKIGEKVIKGHDHTAAIINGCYGVGKSSEHMVYEGAGPSSHSNAHAVQYANGKRAIIFVINGKFCLPRPTKKLKS